MARKKVDWEAIKQLYLTSSESMADLAERFGLSKRAIEKKASEEGWAALRKAGKISAVKVSPKKSESPKTHRQPIQPNRSRQHSSVIDELEVLETAIATLSGAIEGAEVKSLEGAASSLAKLLELRRKFAPPTAAALAEQVLALGISPTEFVQELKDQWSQK